MPLKDSMLALRQLNNFTQYLKNTIPDLTLLLNDAEAAELKLKESNDSLERVNTEIVKRERARDAIPSHEKKLLELQRQIAERQAVLDGINGAIHETRERIFS